MNLLFEDIKGYEGLYKINRNGEVKSCNNDNNKLFHFDKDGYKICSMLGRPKKVHRLLAIQFIPNDDLTKIEIDHIDRNRSNNDLKNLRWVNRSINCRNRNRNGCISSHTGFRKNGDEFTNYRGSYTIPNTEGKMIIVRKCSCINRKIVEDWLEDIKEKYP